MDIFEFIHAIPAPSDFFAVYKVNDKKVYCQVIALAFMKQEGSVSPFTYVIGGEKLDNLNHWIKRADKVRGGTLIGYCTQ